MRNRKGYPVVRTEDLATLIDFHSPIPSLTQEDCLLSRTAGPGASETVNIPQQCITATGTWCFSLPLVGKVGRAVSRLLSRKKRDVPTPPPKLRIGRTSSFAELNSPVLSRRSGNLSEHGVSDALLVCHL